MAQRTVALCNGKYIEIETIYTVINGQQINIPDKLKDLRDKSQSNELFCPCGCGTNLILVAGDKNLREQHFREKTGTGECECLMPIEGKTSVDSKIVLKCWLDDKLQASDIESRVPINTVDAAAGPGPGPVRPGESGYFSRQTPPPPDCGPGGCAEAGSQKSPRRRAGPAG